MAKRINYTDKTAIQNDETIKEENKVTDGNMNEIKKVVNENADELEEKQNKEIGKGLSTNDFTNEYRQKLDELENYDDTLVKQDIEKIKNKNEFQDKDIENLQQKNIQLQTELEQTKTNLENYAIHGKSTGEYIHLTDSSETDCRVDVKGNAQQATREGYNELENTLTDKTVEGITVKVNKDKSVTLNGTAKADINLFLIGDEGAKTLVLTLKKSVSYKNISGIDLIYRKIDGNYGRINNNQIFTPAEDILIGSVYIQIKSGTTLNNTYYLLLVQGTEDKPYEQYGASPSLDYPSKIETVKGSVKVTSCNKNLLDMEENVFIEKYGLKLETDENNELTLNGKSTNATFVKLYGEEMTVHTNVTGWKTKILKKGTYTLSINKTGETSDNNINLLVRQGKDTANSTTITQITQIGSKTTASSKFEIEEDTEIAIWLWLNTNNTLNDFKLKVQLERGDKATEIIGNQEDSVVLPIQEEMCALKVHENNQNYNYIAKDGTKYICDEIIKKNNKYYYRKWIDSLNTTSAKSALVRTATNNVSIIYFVEDLLHSVWNVMTSFAMCNKFKQCITTLIDKENSFAIWNKNKT